MGVYCLQVIMWLFFNVCASNIWILQGMASIWKETNQDLAKCSKYSTLVVYSDPGSINWFALKCQHFPLKDEHLKTYSK